MKNLVIEITETEQNDELSSKKKRQIADDWKAMLALDDYGTGYNGEVALLLFQPNIIKVDINIVHGVDRDSDRLNLLKNIIQYARQRNIRVLAEGVGSRDELKKQLLSAAWTLFKGIIWQHRFNTEGYSC